MPDTGKETSKTERLFAVRITGNQKLKTRNTNYGKYR
jgi:hypothetical protein